MTHAQNIRVFYPTNGGRIVLQTDQNSEVNLEAVPAFEKQHPGEVGPG
jgi:hypothetical protein